MTTEQRIREYVRIAYPIALRALEAQRQGTTAANDIADGGCAANAGRGQATAAPYDESLTRPAVD